MYECIWLSIFKRFRWIGKILKVENYSNLNCKLYWDQFFPLLWKPKSKWYRCMKLKVKVNNIWQEIRLWIPFEFYKGKRSRCWRIVQGISQFVQVKMYKCKYFMHNFHVICILMFLKSAVFIEFYRGWNWFNLIWPIKMYGEYLIFTQFSCIY